MMLSAFIDGMKDGRPAAGCAKRSCERLRLLGDDPRRPDLLPRGLHG